MGEEELVEAQPGGGDAGLAGKLSGRRESGPRRVEDAPAQPGDVVLAQPGEMLRPSQLNCSLPYYMPAWALLCRPGLLSFGPALLFQPGFL
jgi:hypothetical protein